VPLAGEPQRQNAALAIAAAGVLGPPVDDDVVRGALRRLRWPGRFEVIKSDPPIVLDGAHNGASAEALAATLEAFAAGRPIHLIVGINRDKDARATLRPLIRVAELVWATQSSGNRRALEAVQLGALCQRLGADVTVEPDLSVALDRARGTRQGSVVCVTGSLMLVGQARATLGLPAPEQLW
jgi:dihydrofolate synthase/folylpolyglutamate synthase